MGDTSQSRYSIIERLTNTELELLNSKISIEEEITNAENEFKYCEKELTTLKETLNRGVEEQLKDKEHQIERAKDKLLWLQTNKAGRLKGIEDKLKVVKNGIASVGEISKAASIEASKT